MSKFRAILRRRWPVILVATLLGVVAGFLSASLTSSHPATTYLAQQVIVSNRDTSGTPALVQQDSLRVTRGEVRRVAAQKLGIPDSEIDSLTQRIQTLASTESSSISISSTDEDPKAALRRVTAFADAFLQVVNADLQSEEQRQLAELKTRVEESTAALQTFDQKYPDFAAQTGILTPEQINALRSERDRLLGDLSNRQQAYDTASLNLSQRAPYGTLGPEQPKPVTSILPKVPRSPLFRAGLLGIIALLLGVGLVMIIERVNVRIDTREELAEVIDIPIIAEIGHVSKRRMPQQEDGRVRLEGVWAEHYRRIRAAIQFYQAREPQPRPAAMPNGANGTNGANGAYVNGSGQPNGAVAHHDAEPRVFLFTSTLPGEGKSTSAALTAIALAETGIDTLVVNADFRKPRVDQLLGAAPSPSLEDRARLDVNRATVDQVVQASDLPHLWLAASGPATYEVGRRLDAAREVAEEGARRSATVLIDSTPLRVANDPIDLLPVVDGVILIVRAGRSTVRSIEETMELLRLHEAPMVGAVLIGTIGSRELYAYYDSYYGEVARGSHPPTPAPADAPTVVHTA